MSNLFKALFAFAGFTIIMQGCIKKERSLADYPIKPVPLTSVQLTDNFWVPRIKRIIAIPMELRNTFLQGSRDTSSSGITFPDDAELFRIIEGASYSLKIFPDIEQEKFIDTLISRIRLTPDGRTYLKGHSGADSLMSHPVTSPGPLYEAAVAHFMVTGKRNLIDIALRSADLILEHPVSINPAEIPGYGIAAGLLELYRSSREKKYFDRAKDILNHETGRSITNPGIYSSLMDIAVMEKDTSQIAAIRKSLEDIVTRKMEITGSTAFPFSIPAPENTAGYRDCGVCSSVSAITLSHKLFLLTGNSEYYDLIERILYNSVLPGVSLTGEKIMCFNPVESKGNHSRTEWLKAGPCRTEILRFIPSLPGIIYASGKNGIYLNLFISNNAVLHVGIEKVSVSVKENFPWEGKAEISVNPEKPFKFKFRIRIPGWTDNEAFPGRKYEFTDNVIQVVKISVNGRESKIIYENGYAVINRKWKTGDKIEIDFPMLPRYVAAQENSCDTGNVCIQRGPLVFCAEQPADPMNSMRNLMVKRKDVPVTEFVPGLLNGTQVIKTPGYRTMWNMKGSIDILPEKTITFIPYFLWNNRGTMQMKLWLPDSPCNTRPFPAPTIAFRSWISSIKADSSISALNDQIFPLNPNDTSVASFNWRPLTGQWVWVQYDFPEPQRISRTKVYWLDNSPRGAFNVPAEWELLYLKENIWTPVRTMSPYPALKNRWSILNFAPVKVSSVKIKARLKNRFSGGMYEWVIE